MALPKPGTYMLFPSAVFVGRNANIQRQRTDLAKVKNFWKMYYYVATLHHASGESKMAGENKYIVKFKVEKKQKQNK